MTATTDTITTIPLRPVPAHGVFKGDITEYGRVTNVARGAAPGGRFKATPYKGGHFWSFDIEGPEGTITKSFYQKDEVMVAKHPFCETCWDHHADGDHKYKVATEASPAGGASVVFASPYKLTE